MLALLGADPFPLDMSASGQATADAAAQAALAAVSAQTSPPPSTPTYSAPSPWGAGQATVDAAVQAALEAANAAPLPPPPVYTPPSPAWAPPSPYSAGTATVDAATKAAIEAAQKRSAPTPRQAAPVRSSAPASSGPSTETLTKVSDYASKAADAIRSFFHKDEAPVPVPQYGREPEDGMSDYLPYVAGGGVAAVFLALLLKR